MEVKVSTSTEPLQTTRYDTMMTRLSAVVAFQRPVSARWSSVHATSVSVAHFTAAGPMGGGGGGPQAASARTRARARARATGRRLREKSRVDRRQFRESR